MMDLGHYILGGEDGHTPIKVGLMTWARWFETGNRRVGFTELPNGGFISTVFLGIDHGWGEGHSRPVLFETMSKIGDEWGEDYFERYCTWAEAEAGHARIVREAFETIEHVAVALSQALTPGTEVK